MAIDQKPTTKRGKAAAKPETEPAAASKPAVSAPVLRKKELIERVVERSGVKKKDAKPTIEAMLAVLGEALAAGEELNLQPLGKVMVKKTKELANAKMMVCRIRQRNAVEDDKVVKIPT
ncbi:HU family DNA-binding protein [Profundibacter sp.]